MRFSVVNSSGLSISAARGRVEPGDTSLFDRLTAVSY
jgi:hypothetical protein